MAKKKDPLPLEDSELPSLFRLADRGADGSKRWYFAMVGGELVCISLAAIAKIFGQALAPWIVSFFHIRIQEVPFQGSQMSGKDLTDTIAGYAIPTLFLALAGFMYIMRLIKRYDQFWRARRALGEATRELAWRYCMRALPDDLRASQPLGLDDSNKAFQKEFGKLRAQGDKLQLGPPVGPEITPKMREIRDKVPSAQRNDYLKGRLEAATQWYTTRANHYRLRMSFFQGARILSYIIGGMLIFVNALGSYGLGAMTTIAGALGTWLVARHYEDLSQSYSTIAGELNVLNNTAPSVDTGDHASLSGSTRTGNMWAQFVDMIEIKLSGERQDWLRESKIGDAAN